MWRAGEEPGGRGARPSAGEAPFVVQPPGRPCYCLLDHSGLKHLMLTFLLLAKVRLFWINFKEQIIFRTLDKQASVFFKKSFSGEKKGLYL